MFARLKGPYHVNRLADTDAVNSASWLDSDWVETAREATKLPAPQAQNLAHEFETREPGPTYTTERDENGGANLPPYGLNNFVVRRTK